jgi:hypothetical protein
VGLPSSAHCWCGAGSFQLTGTLLSGLAISGSELATTVALPPFIAQFEHHGFSFEFRISRLKKEVSRGLG